MVAVTTLTSVLDDLYIITNCLGFDFIKVQYKCSVNILCQKVVILLS